MGWGSPIGEMVDNPVANPSSDGSDICIRNLYMCMRLHVNSLQLLRNAILTIKVAVKFLKIVKSSLAHLFLWSC